MLNLSGVYHVSVVTVLSVLLSVYFSLCKLSNGTLQCSNCLKFKIFLVYVCVCLSVK